MVMLFVRGKPVGSLEENPDVLQRLVEAGEKVEFRSDCGKELGAYQPRQEPICPWEPELTHEELDRRAAESGGMKLADFWQKMGVQ
jgi:hypothetical protein